MTQANFVDFQFFHVFWVYPLGERPPKKGGAWYQNFFLKKVTKSQSDPLREMGGWEGGEWCEKSKKVFLAKRLSSARNGFQNQSASTMHSQPGKAEIPGPEEPFTEASRRQRGGVAPRDLPVSWQAVFTDEKRRYSEYGASRLLLLR